MPLATQLDASIEHLEVSAYTVPTDFPESDGTLEWDKTTLVLVKAQAGDVTGLGYTYADPTTAHFIEEHLLPLIHGKDAMAVSEHWQTMVHRIRNLGRAGVASMAISAVDNALWDLKARLLELPLAVLLGQVQKGIRLYGSGGFTSYSESQLESQMRGWVQNGFSAVKMKIGREPRHDLERVRIVRKAIGTGPAIFVDANGAYTRKEALAFAQEFARLGVRYFEEPVSSDDLEGLHLLRNQGPAGLDIAAGEYGYDLFYFQRMLAAGAVDILQADVTRCGGISDFLRVAALAKSFSIPLSAHTAPAQHLHVCCALPNLIHMEYFHDHVRIESMLFDHVAKPVDGVLYPDLSRHGNGLELKEEEANHYAVDNRR